MKIEQPLPTAPTVESLMNELRLAAEENAALSRRNAELEEQVKKLEHDLAWFRKYVFGRKTERHLGEHLERATGEEADPEEGDALRDPEETVKELAERVTRQARERKKAQDAKLLSRLTTDPDVPRSILRILPPEVEALEEGVDYKIISTKVSHKIAVQPRSYMLLEIHRPVVKLLSDESNNRQKMVVAPIPGEVIERSIADVSFLAYLLVMKFVYHLPLNRIQQMLSEGGFHVNRSTLVRMVIRLSELLKPIYHSLFSSILTSSIITMDEVPCRVGLDAEKPGKMNTAYFWPILGENNEVVFPYANSRAFKHVAEILGEFGGTILSDGYGAYKKFAEERRLTIIHAGCWVHWRRTILEAERVHPAPVKQLLGLIRQLYAIERTARNKAVSYQELLDIRTQQSTPLVDGTFSLVREVLARELLTKGDPLRLALEYGLERESNLRQFLLNPRLPMDTNHLERLLRRIPMGRKAWLFCWQETGAIAVGRIQSLIATCQLHDVDPYTYFVDILQRIDSHKAQDIQLLTPRLWKENFAQNPMRAPLDSPMITS